MGPSGDLAPAEALLQESIALNSQFWEAHFQLGLLFEQKRDFAKAAAALQRAAQLNARSSAVHYRLARLYDRLNQPDRAARERALHQKYAEEEKAATGPNRLNLVVR